MGGGAPIPSHVISAKVSRGLVGKKIVKADFYRDLLRLEMEDGNIVRIHATEWCSLNKTKYGGPFLEITGIKVKNEENSNKMRPEKE